MYSEIKNEIICKAPITRSAHVTWTYLSLLLTPALTEYQCKKINLWACLRDTSARPAHSQPLLKDLPNLTVDSRSHGFLLPLFGRSAQLCLMASYSN